MINIDEKLEARLANGQRVFVDYALIYVAMQLRVFPSDWRAK